MKILAFLFFKGREQGGGRGPVQLQAGTGQGQITVPERDRTWDVASHATGSGNTEKALSTC